MKGIFVSAAILLLNPCSTIVLPGFDCRSTVKNHIKQQKCICILLPKKHEINLKNLRHLAILKHFVKFQNGNNIKWKQLNVVTMGQRHSENINQMITLTVITLSK
jgi:hypothetical protein